MWFVESQPMFRKTISPPTSGSKNTPKKKRQEAGNRQSEGSKVVPCLVYSSTLKVEAMFLRNVGSLSTDYTVSYP
jgi:hypothetical protein